MLLFFESWSHVINHHPVNFGVHSTCRIDGIVFFLCHDATCYNMIKESCDVVANTISHYFVQFGNHELCRNRDITFYIHQVTIVSCEHCRYWPLFLSHHPAKLSCHWLCRRENITFFICHVTSRGQVIERTYDLLICSCLS